MFQHFRKQNSPRETKILHMILHHMCRYKKSSHLIISTLRQLKTLTLLQIEALDQLKHANPAGRFWRKIDGTDVKEGLMESQRGEWNGDEDLGDGQLQASRSEYDQRLDDIKALTLRDQTRQALVASLSVSIGSLEEDIVFLNEGFTSAVNVYTTKFQAQNTPAETLKSCNWDVVEYQTLLQESQALKETYEECVSIVNDEESTERQLNSCKALLRDTSRKGVCEKSLQEEKKCCKSC